MIQVTHHAALRYQERVAACGIGEARRRIREHDRVLQVAVDFGAPVVRLSDGTGLFDSRGDEIWINPRPIGFGVELD